MVSIIIPVYNVEPYIKGTIDSVINQTCADIEIILVNDGSADKSYEICAEYAQTDNRIKLLDQSNQGVSAARNNGIKASHGEWICFIDGDDWIEPNYVETLLNSSDASDDIAECSFFLNTGKGQSAQHHHAKDMLFTTRDEINQLQLQLLARKMCRYQPNSGDLMGAPWAKMFRRDFIIENALEFDRRLPRSQDLVFNLYALENAKQVRYVDIPLYHYRVNDESVCNKFSRKILKNVTLYLQAMTEFLQKYGKGQEFQDAYDVKVLTSVYKCMYLYFFNEGNPETFKAVKDELINFINEEPFRSSIRKVKYSNLNHQEQLFAFFLKHKNIYALKQAVGMRTRIKYGK